MLNRPRHAAICVLVVGALLLLCVVLHPWRTKSADGTPRVVLAAVGDVLLARYVGTQIARHGPEFPFRKTRGLISSADIAFCNLECPISSRGYPRKKRFLFRAEPRAVDGLKYAGFDVVSLANNHTLDYGREALLDTISHLRSAGIASSGAGANRQEALQPAVIEAKGLKIGFLSYTDLPAQGDIPLANRPGIARVDMDTFAREVKAARKQVDVLVVSLHWGVEYQKVPAKRQRMIARAAVDSGADLILGHHPHVLQSVEVYKGKPVAFSLGNFVFDAHRPDAKKTAILRFELSHRGVKLTEVTPVDIVACQPRIRTQARPYMLK